jgi:hypothetical protein
MATVKEIEKIAKRYQGNSLVESFQSKRLAEYGTLSGDAFNQKHSRDHGKFASKPGAQGSAAATAPKQAAIHQQPEAGGKAPPQAHPPAAKPAIPAAPDAHSSAMSSFNSFVAQHKIGIAAAGAAVAAIGIAAATGNLQTAGKILGENSTKITGMARAGIEAARNSKVGAAVGKEVTAIGEKLASHAGEASKAIGGAAETVTQNAKTFASHVGQNLETAGADAKMLANRAKSGIVGGAETALQDAKMVGTHLKQNVQAVGKNIGDTAHTAKVDAKMVVNRTAKGASDALETAKADAGMFGKHVKQNVDAAAGAAKEKIGSVAQAVGERKDQLVGAAKGKVEEVAAHANSAVDSAKGALQKGADKVKDVAATAKSDVGGAKDGASGKLNNAFAGNSPAAYGKASDVTGGIRKGAEAVADAGRKGASSVANAARKGREAVENSVNAVKAAPGRTRDAFRNAKNDVKAALAPKNIGKTIAKGQEKVSDLGKAAFGATKRGAKAAKKGGEGLAAGYKAERKSLAIGKVMDQYPGMDAGTAEAVAFKGAKGASKSAHLAKSFAGEIAKKGEKAAPVAKKGIVRKVAKFAAKKIAEKL